MSNDSDLRAAAERVRIYNANPDKELGATWKQGDYVFGPAKVLADMMTLSAWAAEYLSSQPADGEEAITEETELVEFTDKLGFLCGWRVHKWEDGYVFYFCQAASTSYEVCDWEDRDTHGEIVFPVTTNHDMRRLCGVLGIPLKETT